MTPEELKRLASEATKGPWETLHDNGTVWAHGIVGDFQSCIAQAGWNSVNHIADARLIALAPQLAELCAELAEALTRLYATAPKPPNFNAQTHKYVEALEPAREALAKLEALQ